MITVIMRWDSEKEKEDNMKMLLQHLKDMGFHVLLNESHQLIKDNEKIDIVGVENWGAGGFKKKGDFDKAASRVEKEQFKILLSHDPSHWEQKIINHEMPVELTLSGHTHGMQFGIEIPGWIKWSQQNLDINIGLVFMKKIISTLISIGDSAF